MEHLAAPASDTSFTNLALLRELLGGVQRLAGRQPFLRLPPQQVLHQRRRLHARTPLAYLTWQASSLITVARRA